MPGVYVPEVRIHWPNPPLLLQYARPEGIFYQGEPRMIFSLLLTLCFVDGPTVYGKAPK